ncbi:hypothetical protein EDD85DRAFT_789580 [Armillaria nabsnona]|nr:hypothetical protein EDD85DRAFT_789580 [Armillaria nabsnona]
MHAFIAFPDHSTSLLSHNKSWRYLQEIRTRHKRTQVELTQTQTNAVERTHAGVERRILLAPRPSYPYRINCLSLLRKPTVIKVEGQPTLRATIQHVSNMKYFLPAERPIIAISLGSDMTMESKQKSSLLYANGKKFRMTAGIIEYKDVDSLFKGQRLFTSFFMPTRLRYSILAFEY